MSAYPRKLAEMAELFDLFEDRNARIEALIGIADRFQPVPDRIAIRPFSEEHRVRECETQAYVWAEDLPDNTLKFHFAVENPQGISAMAMSVILDETLSGAPLEEVIEVPSDVPYRFFGRELSMGKTMGLIGIVGMVKRFARERLAKRGGAS